MKQEKLLKGQGIDDVLLKCGGGGGGGVLLLHAWHLEIPNYIVGIYYKLQDQKYKLTAGIVL